MKPLLTSLALVAAVLISGIEAASAQDARDVTIDFEVGDFDSSEGDWPITVVNVSGDLEPDEVFVVELRDGDGEVVWAGEGVYSPPTTSVPVDSFVAVGGIEEAAIGQRLPEETTTTTTTNPPPAEPVVAGDIVTNPTTTSAPAVTPVPPPPPPETTDTPAPPPTVAGDVTNTPEPELPRQGSGLGGAGQLALSMVIAVVFVAILFRTPLPLGHDPTVATMKRFLASLLLSGLMLLATASPAAAAETLDVEGEINGRDIAGSDGDSPIELDPTEAVPISITLRNAGNRTEEVRFVRLEGQALGLTFLTYDLGVRTSLAPGEETTFEAELDFFDLDEQATGYLGTSLRVYDADRLLLGQEDFVLDVKGRTTSTLGLFAFAVLGIAGFSITVLVLNTLRRRLASNRFVRGLQFAVAGAAVGVTLALGLAILRIDFAEAEEWLPLVFLPTVIAFGIGYLAPGPLSLSIRDVREEEALEALAEEALIRRSGELARATSPSVFIDVRPTSEPPVDSRAEEPARH